MLVNELFDQVVVYEGVAERTGVQFERSAVRHSDACCGSLTALMRKARAAGDGYFYLPLSAWPANTEKIELRKPWVGLSTV